MRLLAIILILALPACASVSKRVAEAQPYSSQILWPEEFSPGKADFYVHNKIEIDASAQDVLDVLIEAGTWTDWYEGASNLQFVKGEGPDLTEDSVFTWKTMGLNFTSEITGFDPPKPGTMAPSRLSWVSRKSTIQGYHAWLLVPMNDGRTLLVTDESQNGFLATLQGVFQRNKLRKLHDVWLGEIKNRAEARG